MVGMIGPRRLITTLSFSRGAIRDLDHSSAQRVGHSNGARTRASGARKSRGYSGRIDDACLVADTSALEGKTEVTRGSAKPTRLIRSRRQLVEGDSIPNVR